MPFFGKMAIFNIIRQIYRFDGILWNFMMEIGELLLCNKIFESDT
jgi:hypothetical protein